MIVMFKYLIVIFNNDLLFLKQRVETPLLAVITCSKQQKGALNQNIGIISILSLKDRKVTEILPTYSS